MKRILFGLLFLIGFSAQAQIWSGSQVQISQFGRLKRLTVKPATPADGFLNFYNLNDSLHAEIDTKDWNLGKIVYQDSLGYYYLKTQTDSIVTKVMDSVNDMRDTLYLYIDSINLLQDTTLAHNIRLIAIENDTTHYKTAWDSVAIFHRRLDWHTDSIVALYDTAAVHRAILDYDIRTATLWGSAEPYAVNDIVSYINASFDVHYYLCKTAHNSTGTYPTENDGAYWKELFYFPGRTKFLQDSTTAGTVGWYARDTVGATQKAIHAYLSANHYSKDESDGLLDAKLDTALATYALRNSWNGAAAHKTTEDALQGLVKVENGSYSAITDNSTNWNNAILTETDPLWTSWLLTDPIINPYRNLGSAAYARLDQLSNVNHLHTGVYEPLISKSTGYLRYTGSAWEFKNEAYSLTSHNHTGTYLTDVTGTAPIVSSGGMTPAISITAATTGAAGSMSAADKLKLDGIAAGATVNNVEDMSRVFGSAAYMDIKNLVQVLPNGATRINKIDYSWPSADGTSGYVLSTNGAGVLTWVDKTGGIAGSIKSINGSSKTNQTLVGSPWNFVESGDSSSIHTLTIPAATNSSNGYATSAHIAAIEANTAKVTNATHTGDVTGATALTIGANKVTLGMMATLAANSIIGNNTGSAITPKALTPAEVRTLLNVADGATANVGTVTSVAMTVPTGLSISGTPVTTSGTLDLTLESGYSIPTTSDQNVWTAKQAALNGNGFVKMSGTTVSYDNSTYLTAEADPVWGAWLLTDPKPDMTRNLGSMAYSRIDQFSPYNHTHDYSATYATIGQEFYLGTTKIAINRASAAQSLTGITSIDGSAASLKSPATTGLAQLTGMGTGTTRVKTVRDANDQLLELGGSYTPSGTWNWTSATVTWPTFNQNTTGNAATATKLATARAIYGNNFDGTTALTQVITSTYGGTGNGFTKFTGPATTEKTFTLPNANATLLYDGGALGTPSSGTVTNLTGTAAINITGIADNVKLTDALTAPGTYFLTMAPNASSGGLLIEPTMLMFTTSTGLLSTPLIKITGGSPGVNKALISDADGDASWSASALGSAAYTATSAYDASGTAAGLIATHNSTYTHANIATAYNDRMKWDGGSTGLVAATGRTSLGLGDMALETKANYALIGQTMYIGTTGVAINRGSAALTLAGITLTTPNIGTPSAGVLTNCTGLPVAGGGTGLSTIDAGSYLKGNGTSAVDPQTPAEVRTDLSLEHKSIVIQVYDKSQQVAVADGVAYISIPHGLAGWSISNVQAHSYEGTSGNIGIEVANSNGRESTTYISVFGVYHYIYAGYYDSKSNSTAEPLYNLVVDDGYTLQINVKVSDNSRYGLDVRIDFTK